MKLGVRQNRYGLFGDNEFNKSIEILKRPLPVTVIKAKEARDPLQLSQDGMISAF
jgi:hypothetical protein